jgi:membrane-associated phospholipid phosphatase
MAVDEFDIHHLPPLDYSIRRSFNVQKEMVQDPCDCADRFPFFWHGNLRSIRCIYFNPVRSKMKKTTKILVGVAAILFVGVFLTIFDLQISLALFNEASGFGHFFEVAGEIPAFLIGAFCLGGLITTRDRSHKVKNITAILGYGVMLLLICAMGVLATFNYMDIEMAAWMVLPILVVAGLAWFTASRVPKIHSAEFRRAAAIGIIVMVAEILVVNLIKTGWARLRMRDMIDPLAQFTPWFLPQKGINGEATRSFPSGHSANAAMLVWLTLLPAFLPKCKGKEAWLIGTAAIWTVWVMISRVVMGAHFATDTLAGVGITLGLFYLVTSFFTRHKKESIK